MLNMSYTIYDGLQYTPICRLNPSLVLAVQVQSELYINYAKTVRRIGPSRMIILLIH